jgi:hypothetical protein
VILDIDPENKERMISAAFEYANMAKESNYPLANYHLAGRLFDKAGMYEPHSFFSFLA